MKGNPKTKIGSQRKSANRIEVECTGLLHVEGIGKNGFVDVDKGSTVGDLLDKLHIQRDHQKFVTAFINGVEKNRSTQLQDKDKVTLLLPVGGG